MMHGNGRSQEYNYTRKWKQGQPEGQEFNKISSLLIATKHCRILKRTNLKWHYIIKRMKNAEGKKIIDRIQDTKILIIGDSHARGMVAKLRHNLEEDYSVQGLGKPGADLPGI